MSRANRDRGGATLHTCLQVGTVIPRRSPTDSTMLQVSSLPACLHSSISDDLQRRQLELLQVVPTAGIGFRTSRNSAANCGNL